MTTRNRSRRPELYGTRTTSLDVKNFAQIDHAHVNFGDLTLLVGPQATGKSLLLQWLKVALDAGEVVAALREAGHDVSTAKNLVDLIFGEGKGTRADTRLPRVFS